MNRGTVRTIKQRQIHNDKVYEYDQYDYSAEADDKMLKKGWSPDMVVRRARKENIFTNDSIPSTSTLYHWIDCGIMRTKNIDLLEKVSRKPRNDSPTHSENRRVLGKDRSDKVESREHFGHWAIDTLIRARAKDDPVLLTLAERKTRFEIVLKIAKQDQAMNQLYEQLGEQAETIFNTITSDNGSEFAGINELLTGITDVFFAHPYHPTSVGQRKSA